MIGPGASDTITADLRRIATGLANKRPLMAALGKQLEIDLRAHFRMRDAEPNKRGFPRRHFWRSILQRTGLESVTDAKATVVISAPELIHKIEGGVVSAKRARALSIPLSAEAYKTGSASLFPRPLAMVARPGKPPLLIEPTPKGAKPFILHYVLVASVRHDKDPRAMPPPQKIEASLLSRARAHLARVTG